MTKAATQPKTASITASPAPPTQALQIDGAAHGLNKEMSQGEMKASLAGAVIGGAAQKAYSQQFVQLELSDLLIEMRKAGNEAVKGDLGRVERMLMNQALTLDTIFNNLAERASRQEYIKNMDTYLRLALKAQSQARATAETLSIIKNPMPYIKQANIAQGHQQVNNAPRTGSDSLNQQTKILEQQHGEWLDTGTQSKAGGVNPQLATVETDYRAKD